MGKCLVVCFDGTWNAADNGGEETNVVKLSRAIPGRPSAGPFHIWGRHSRSSRWTG
jgi:hypothetical protein